MIKIWSNLVVKPSGKWLFSIFSCHTKIDDQPLKNLAKFGYKTNKQVEKSKNTIRC
jgi:hypothetical protein